MGCGFEESSEICLNKTICSDLSLEPSQQDSSNEDHNMCLWKNRKFTLDLSSHPFSLFIWSTGLVETI